MLHDTYLKLLMHTNLLFLTNYIFKDKIQFKQKANININFFSTFHKNTNS